MAVCITCDEYKRRKSLNGYFESNGCYASLKELMSDKDKYKTFARWLDRFPVSEEVLPLLKTNRLKKTRKDADLNLKSHGWFERTRISYRKRIPRPFLLLLSLTARKEKLARQPSDHSFP